MPTASERRTAVRQFYLPVIFADFYFPWSLLLPVALALVPWRRLAVLAHGTWAGTAGGDAPPSAHPNSACSSACGSALIVAFFSVSRAQQDLYVLPFIPAGAALVGGVVAHALGVPQPDRLARWTRGALFVMIGSLALLGAAAVVLLGVMDGPLKLAGGPAAGAALLVAALIAWVALMRRALRAALVASLAGVLAVLWTLVLVGLPDFERYKPVPKLAAAIRSQPVPASRVGTYRVAVPSLVFYLQRHVDQMFDEQQLREFFAGDGPRYCVIPETDYDRVKGVLPMATRIVTTAQRAEARFRDSDAGRSGTATPPADHHRPLRKSVPVFESRK